MLHRSFSSSAITTTMAALFNVDADFAGAKNLEAHLGTELQGVNKELAALSSREAEYNRLSQDLTLAVTAAQSYAKGITEERINTSLANARVSAALP
jgi:succinoglycan biosynthesis transport protein ExoP